jgi:hypothetical protein
MFARILRAILRREPCATTFHGASHATISPARMAMASDIVTRRAAPLWIGPRMYRSA